MTESSFASLNPALLARKGGAKPAMRPQFAAFPQDNAAIATLADEQLEDLGWNDMGAEDEGYEDQDPGESRGETRNQAHGERRGAEIVSIAAKAANEDVQESASPIIRRQQKNLSNRVLAQAAMRSPSEASPTTRSNPAASAKTKSQDKGRRAAFTLRLDPDRHLKLRLASAMKGMSAQALVTEALDAMLAGIEELDGLAERMKRD